MVGYRRILRNIRVFPGQRKAEIHLIDLIAAVVMYDVYFRGNRRIRKVQAVSHPVEITVSKAHTGHTGLFRRHALIIQLYLSACIFRGDIDGIARLDFLRIPAGQYIIYFHGRLGFLVQGCVSLLRRSQRFII